MPYDSNLSSLLFLIRSFDFFPFSFLSFSQFCSLPFSLLSSISSFLCTFLPIYLPTYLPIFFLFPVSCPSFLSFIRSLVLSPSALPLVTKSVFPPPFPLPNSHIMFLSSFPCSFLPRSSHYTKEPFIVAHWIGYIYISTKNRGMQMMAFQSGFRLPVSGFRRRAFFLPLFNYGAEQPKSRHKHWATCSSIHLFACTAHSFAGSSLLASLIRSHRSLIRLLSPTCLTRMLHCAHSFTSSLSPKVVGK